MYILQCSAWCMCLDVCVCSYLCNLVDVCMYVWDLGVFRFVYVIRFIWVCSIISVFSICMCSDLCMCLYLCMVSELHVFRFVYMFRFMCVQIYTCSDLYVFRFILVQICVYDQIYSCVQISKIIWYTIYIHTWAIWRLVLVNQQPYMSRSSVSPPWLSETSTQKYKFSVLKHLTKYTSLTLQIVYDISFIIRLSFIMSQKQKGYLLF